MVYHITKIVSRGGRRINDRAGVRVNWCGGEFTDHDCTFQDARRIVMTGWKKDGWERCEKCFSRLLDLDFKASARVED